MVKARTKKNVKHVTISEYFNLGKSQYSLDFFDAYITRDTPLFIDPWAIRCAEDEFSVSAYQKIHSVFVKLIGHVQRKEEDAALDLLDNLHEPRETGLGYAVRTKNGSGVGPEKPKDIYDALARSKAVQTGLLTDLEDTALHIEGIANDNISDIVTNIIRFDLIKYTQEQCDLYGIEMASVQTRVYWDEEKKDFIQSNERTLIIDGKKILLVPKKILRRKLSISYADFYEKGILEYEQARHFDARTALCRTLKGKIVEKPYKKTLKESGKYKLSRELVFDYIVKHPDLLEKYKDKKIHERLLEVNNNGILRKQNRPDHIEQDVPAKIAKLKSIPPGATFASEYHKHIADCLNTIFNNPGTPNYLSGPKIEDKQNEGRKRIDITFHNSSDRGFFSRLSNYGGLFCAKIFFECKNYRHDLANPEYDQMTGRFNNRTSTIGFIVCRTIGDAEKALETCRDFVFNGRGYVFVLTDVDIINLLDATISEDKDIKIDILLQEKMNRLSEK